MEISITDLDVADINIKLAEQCLIKAEIEDNIESKIKSLIFARKSIDNSLAQMGININELRIKKDLSSFNGRQTTKDKKL